MLQILGEFRKALSDAMLPAIHRRVILYGFSYTGRFLKWYAEYYHNIKVDFIVSLDMSFSQSYEEEIYRPSLLDFDYKDSKKAVIWLATPLDKELETLLKEKGFVLGENLVDFYGIIYGNDIRRGESHITDDKYKKKTRSIQFLEWLEWKYGCDFITAIDAESLSSNGNAYRVTTQKEIFPVLDACHCQASLQDGIFDFGCGKGGALVSFMDYGFQKCGGVEFDKGLYDICMNNMKKLGIDKNVNLECINDDATKVATALDEYSWFYFFDPFGDNVFAYCMQNIRDSLKRRKRKIRVIFINPHCHEVMSEMDEFRLVNSFTISMRQRVVNVWETYE